jgi:hypothetical protein
MPFDKSVLKDYIDVAERLRAWYEAYPNARIETSIVLHTDSRVTVKALAFRGDTSDPDVSGRPRPYGFEERPAGVGHSSMAIPGSTPYTRGSEVENCETSAVGRALVMAGLPSKRIASDDEIRSKAGETKKQPDPVVEAAQKIFLDDPAIADWVEAIRAAATKEELQQIGQEIVGSSLDADQRKALQAVWKSRATELA